jgi:hypothetical protein
MATVEEIARDLLGSLATSAGAPLAAKWIDNRYQELVAKVKFKHLREIGELSVPAVVDSGTASATRGSTTVTGSGTSWTTDIGSGAQEYWYIKVGSAWYKIASVGGDTSITLATAYAEDDASDNSYAAVKRHLPLDSNARWIGDFVHTRLRNKLDGPLSYEEMNRRYPGRKLTGSYPEAVALVGTDSNNTLMVEVYPPPDKSEIIHYVFWNLPTALSFGSTIPPQIDPHILREGALIDLYRYEMAQALRLGRVDTAGFWRNESRTQMTKWERYIQDAKRADRGADDASFILERVGRKMWVDEQRTARDIVLDRWTWPA